MSYRKLLSISYHMSGIENGYQGLHFSLDLDHEVCFMRRTICHSLWSAQQGVEMDPNVSTAIQIGWTKLSLAHWCVYGKMVKHEVACRGSLWCYDHLRWNEGFPCNFPCGLSPPQVESAPSQSLCSDLLFRSVLLSFSYGANVHFSNPPAKASMHFFRSYKLRAWLSCNTRC